MPRQRKHTDRRYSSISDEQLILIINQERERNPSEFSNSRAIGITDSRKFLTNTSARGIAPIKKWL